MTVTIQHEKKFGLQIPQTVSSAVIVSGALWVARLVVSRGTGCRTGLLELVILQSEYVTPG